MKIQNDQMRSLLEQGQAHKKPGAGGVNFESLLANELQSSRNTANSTVSAGSNAAALAMQIRAAQELGGTAEDAGPDAIYLKNMEKLLDKWDLYGTALARPDAATLKDVNTLLDGMSGELAALKEALPELEGDNTALSGLVNELELLTVTERIKLNRGDYL